MKKYKFSHVLILIALTLCLLFVMGGCTDDDESTQSTTSTPSEDEEVFYGTPGGEDDFWERFNDGGGEVHTFEGEESSGEVDLPEE